MTSSSASSASSSRLAPRATLPSSNSDVNTRLFVGNLTTSVSEHDLVALFRPFGTLRKLDLVFHRSGALKGQHKGFAFVEFATAEQAAKAVATVDGKPLRGREVHVNYASSSKQSTSADSLERVGPHRRKRNAGAKADEEQAGRSTMLSLNKNLNRNDSTNARIAAMEAKLETIRNQTSSKPIKSPSTSSLTAFTRPSHLPPKPPPPPSSKG